MGGPLVPHHPVPRIISLKPESYDAELRYDNRVLKYRVFEVLIWKQSSLLVHLYHGFLIQTFVELPDTDDVEAVAMQVEDVVGLAACNEKNIR